MTPAIKLKVIALTLALLSVCSVLPAVSVAQQDRKSDTDRKQGIDLPLPSVKAGDDNSEHTPYKIRIGDELDIKIIGEIQLSHSYPVGPDGRITFDYIGSVEAAGLTREQLAERLKARLSEIYYNPLISVAITKYSTLKAYVLGQVMRPGMIEFTNDTTLLRALSMAGGVARESAPGQGYGPTIYGPPESVDIIRNPDTVITINLKDLLESGNRKLDVPIHEDDFIFVPMGKHRRVFVMGEVKNPMVVDLKNDDMDVITAIAQAGGLTSNASQSQIKLIRKENPTDKQPKVINVNFKAMAKKGDLTQDLRVRDQDVILVPKSKISYLRFVFDNGGSALIIPLVLAATGY